MSTDPHEPQGWLPYSAERASDVAVQLYDYWVSKRSGGDGIPSRDDIRPEEIKLLLPHIWLLDFDRASRVFRYRLIGTAVVEGVGRDYTGHTLEECHPNVGAYETAAAALLRLMEDARPIWRRGEPMFHHHIEVLRLENLLLPLAQDRQAPDRILGMTLFFDSDDRFYWPGVVRAT